MSCHFQSRDKRSKWPISGNLSSFERTKIKRQMAHDLWSLCLSSSPRSCCLNSKVWNEIQCISKSCGFLKPFTRRHQHVKNIQKCYIDKIKLTYCLHCVYIVFTYCWPSNSRSELNYIDLCWRQGARSSELKVPSQTATGLGDVPKSNHSCFRPNICEFRTCSLLTTYS